MRSLFGEGIRIIDYDAFAAARGGAYVATADNPSAIAYNPAGITQLAGHQFRLGTYALTYQASYTSPTGRQSETKREFHALPQFFYTFTPANCALSFGLGAYSPYGLSLQWPEDTGFRSVGLEGRLTYFRLNPVVGWRIHQTFSVAAGPTLNFAETDLRQGLSPVAGNDQFRFKGNGADVGFNLGLLWHPHSKHSLGLHYRGPTTANFQGHSETTSTVPPLSLSQSASADLPFPQIITAGWSWRPTPRWNLEFNADWADWSAVQSLSIHQTTPLPPIRLDWRSSWNFSCGATRYFANGWRTSAGYIYSENSVPDPHFTPLVPDSERHVFSVGAGRSGKHRTWDAAYQLTYGSPRTIQGSAPSLAGQSADGRYEFLAHAFTVSLGRRF